MPGLTTTDKLLKELDPLKVGMECWPQDVLSVEQQEITYSFWDNDETVVAAANGMGKDWIAARCALLAVLMKTPCRGVTTSAKDEHLRVLWSEMDNFINTSRYPLKAELGGPLLIKHQEIKKLVNGVKDPKSYLIGMVASQDTEAALQGHWLPRYRPKDWSTFFMADECSSVPHRYYKMVRSWSDRRFLFGNTWPCENFFRYAVEGRPGSEDRGGDRPRLNGDGLARKVFCLSVEDSPNVKYARWQISQGIKPDDTIVVPGIKRWASFQEDLHSPSLDEAEKSVMLFAKWYKGKEIRLFPTEWLTHAEALADLLKGRRRKAKAGGCDPGEGGANTAFVAIDELGVLERYSLKTPDTNDIFGEWIEFVEKWKIPVDRMCTDRGGGGKQLVDRLRAFKDSSGNRPYMGARTVAFGETPALPIQRMRQPVPERVDVKESRYTFVNMRAQLYGELSECLDPTWEWDYIDPLEPDLMKRLKTASGFAIPRWFHEFRQQLEPIPKKRDGEGRLILPPKNKKNPEDKEITLVDLIGHSPDEADALVLALHGLLHPSKRLTAMAG